MTVAAPNPSQSEYWNGDTGRTWTRFQEKLDRAMADVTTLLLAAVNAAPNARILDIGCGAGDTTLALARQVGSSGAVLGVDVSEPLIERARERLAAAGPDLPVTFRLADASTLPPSALPFDHLVSRFGVMFFELPEAAFTALRQQLRPGGRLTFLCWQAPKRNQWATLPMAALAAFVPPPEAPPDPFAPGPFAFADPERVVTILRRAGWSDITVTGHTIAMWVGEGVDALEQGVQFYSKIGPAASALKDAPDDVRRVQAPAALREALAPLVQADQLALQGAVWLVEAIAPSAPQA